MNNLVPVPARGEPIMTSRQIAEYLEIRHDSVKRAIERLAERAVIVRPPLVDEQIEDVITSATASWSRHSYRSNSRRGLLIAGRSEVARSTKMEKAG